MKNIFYFIILLCSVEDLLKVKCDDSAEDELSQLNIDVKKINSQWKVPNYKKYNNINDNEDEAEIFKLQWSGNGDFGKKYSNDLPLKKSLWNENSDEINSNNYRQKEEIDLEELSSTPSRVLEPPFEFYSSSIHNLAIENINKLSTTTESYNEIKKNTFHIYEITSRNLSTTNTINNKNHDENVRSFIIDDPSRELKSSDSLRSVILNRQQDSINYDKKLTDNKLKNINTENVIGSNRRLIKNNKTGKSFYVNRGNRKYQKAVSNDETTPVRDKTWSYPTDNKYTWKKIRPINRGNNYRRFGTISRVYNLRTDERDDTNDRVSGTSRYDYSINHRSPNIAGRFLCPLNSDSHVYLADRASRCQIFYVCFGGDIGVPMMCPNGTLFSEELQVCDWWYNVKC